MGALEQSRAHENCCAMSGPESECWCNWHAPTLAFSNCESSEHGEKTGRTHQRHQGTLRDEGLSRDSLTGSWSLSEDLSRMYAGISVGQRTDIMIQLSIFLLWGIWSPLRLLVNVMPDSKGRVCSLHTLYINICKRLSAFLQNAYGST